MDKNLTMNDLERETGLTARTIRYYISKKLVPPATTAGRNATYGQEHLDALRQVMAKKYQGLSLEQIRREMSGADPTLSLEPWYLIQVSEDVVVHVRADVAPWRRNQIDRALLNFAQVVAEPNPEESEDH